jgi:hypothetical protein
VEREFNMEREEENYGEFNVETDGERGALWRELNVEREI